jgi:hypothetical protein
LPSFFWLTSIIKPHFHPNDFSVNPRHLPIQKFQVSYFSKILVSSYRATQCQTLEGHNVFIFSALNFRLHCGH